MRKLSYHLILIQSSLRILTDQIDQLNKIIEESNPPSVLRRDMQEPTFAKALAGKPSLTEATQRSNYPLKTSNFSKKREFENMNKIITGRDKQAKEKKSIMDMVYNKIRRSRKGIAFNQIQKKTGFNTKQIANAIYKLKERGMIQAKQRGVYVKR